MDEYDYSQLPQQGFAQPSAASLGGVQSNAAAGGVTAPQVPGPGGVETSMYTGDLGANAQNLDSTPQPDKTGKAVGDAFAAAQKALQNRPPPPTIHVDKFDQIFHSNAGIQPAPSMVAPAAPVTSIPMVQAPPPTMSDRRAKVDVASGGRSVRAFLDELYRKAR